MVVHTLKKKRIIVILGSLAAIGPFSIDMYLPGFPAIARELGTDIGHVALSLSSFFIGISAGQLLYGPVVDCFGRKKPLLIGLALYCAAAIGCAMAPSIAALIALRLFLALGGCAGIVAGRAVVRDLFPVSETAKVFSMLMLVSGIAPIIAPSVGGIVVASFGWRMIFVALAAFSAVMIWTVVRSFPDSRAPDPAVSLRLQKIFSQYAEIVRNPQFVAYAAAGGFAYAGMFAYISEASFIFMGLFGYTELEFGRFFAMNALGLMAGSQLNNLWLRTHDSAKIVRIVGMLLVAVTLMLAGINALAGVSQWGTIVMLFLYLLLLGFLNPNTAALSLTPFTHNAGSASALLGAFQMFAGAAASALASSLHDGTPLPMAGVMAGCALASFLFVQYHEAQKRSAIS